jgi:long-chain-fatty-acid-coA ligase
LYTDFGAYGIKAITIPFYATSSEQQIQFIINDAEIRMVFVGEQDQYDKARRVLSHCPSLTQIIVFDESVTLTKEDNTTLYFKDFIQRGKELQHQEKVEELYRTASNDDLCNILYTSGTTGDSKGVMLTYGQYEAALIANTKCVPVTDTDRVMSFLPFTHIFERAWAYLSLSKGAQIIINTNPKDILISLKETHPTCMSSVPRFWEKVYSGVNEKIESASAIQQKIFNHALSVGKKHNIDYLSKGKTPPLALRLEYNLLNKTILSKVRKQLGFTEPNIFPTAGARISPEIETFVHAIGIDMLAGYGLTESLATVSCNHKGKPFTVGSVGIPIEGLEIKIGENNEVLLKGPTITKGYYKRDEINKAAFDSDGFFHTGDSGYIKDGELFLTERIKDLFKTSNGKYIAPQQIETLLLVDRYIDEVTIIADERKFVSALVVPNYQLLEEYALSHNISFNSKEELCSNSKINKLVMDRISTIQQQLASYEQVKRITLLPRNFSIEAGELTNTLKLKRRVIYENYKDVIEKMYVE